jgi:hypothetical protein
MDKAKKKEEEEDYISESYAIVTALYSWIVKICGIEAYLIN